MNAADLLKRVAAFVAGVVWVAFGFWLGGTDFSVRNSNLGLGFCVATFVGGLLATCPYLDGDK